MAVGHLDLAGGQLRVHRAFRSDADGTGDAQHVLVAQVGGAVDHALDHAGVVPEIDEGQMLAVLAPPGHPAAQRHLPAGVGQPQFTAVIRSHGHRSLQPLLHVVDQRGAFERLRLAFFGQRPQLDSLGFDRDREPGA